MQNKSDQGKRRVLIKPVREATEMKREELVAYANEAGGGPGPDIGDN